MYWPFCRCLGAEAPSSVEGHDNGRSSQVYDLCWGQSQYYELLRCDTYWPCRERRELNMEGESSGSGGFAVVLVLC